METFYPVEDVVPELKQKLETSSVVILQAPPGAGKSTVVPLRILNEPWLANKKIIMLEPRRLAARSVAMRMSELLNETVGKTVGYRVRFENRVSDETRVEVVTEGILTRMIQQDNSLADVGLIIFDEFHERSLQADLGLALSLQVQQILRDDLRIMIMSATLESEKLSSLLNAPIINSKGRQFPIDIKYQAADPNLRLPQQVAKAVRKAFHEQPGDILVFLPGAGEIIRTAELLENENLSARIHALFGDLSFSKQQDAIRPSSDGVRKIVLATSIAETSLTIEGIHTVVDSGFSRVPRFDPRSGLTRLETVRVTKDAADQRAGRAGRLAPGVAYRLWSEGIHSSLVATRSPEILEADLAPLVLELAQWGISDISSLRWITTPPAGAVNQARDILEKLEAIKDQQITNRGRKMLSLPTHPRIAHMLLISAEEEKDSLSLATDIAALLEERDPLPKESGADISLRVEILRKWRKRERVSADQNVLERIEKLASAWRRMLGCKTDNDIVSDKAVGNLTMAAYPERIAKQLEKHSERYKLNNGRLAKLPSHDALTRERYLAVAQLDSGSGEGKIFQAAPLDEADLLKQAKNVITTRWDDEREMVVTLEEKKIGDFVLSSKSVPTTSDDQRLRVICEMIREKGLRVLGWNEKLTDWQARALSLKLWREEENWPDVNDEALLRTLEQWLTPFLSGVNKLLDLQRLDADTILSTVLPYAFQSKINSVAPERILVPSGSAIKLKYFIEGKAPVLEVRLQEVFGMLETPTVNQGKTKIILHLLSPGYKPVQVTQDLRSFWTNTYAEVRKELRSRYPKHSWPDDPWTAVAVRGVKRKNNN
jgi:ATP-dependent helicase HrpB